ncbi:hypothetical protein GCM10022235_44320 [Kribbella ginsengisoli]|uniref:Uncharacterized protein n=1 Tax=Kribbella ginsengisoli TaxID=363865 RepID=A0ABP6XPM4_9ACTN
MTSTALTRTALISTGLISTGLISTGWLAPGRGTRPPQKELDQIDRRRRHRPNLPRPPPQLISPDRQQLLPGIPLPRGLPLITRRLVHTLIALHPETVHHQQNVVNILLKLSPQKLRP